MLDRAEINAELLTELTKLLLCDVKAEDILSGKLWFSRIPCQTLANYMMNSEKFNHHYSATECLNLAKAVSDYICDKAEEHLRDSARGHIHVFDLLTELLYLVLTEENSVVCTRYQELLHWRNLTRSVGEELPISIMYALQDMACGTTNRTNFSWSYLAGHNNKQLNRLMQRGIAEHHYHIWGSTPYFQVSWLSLMNHLCNNSYMQHLRELHEQNERFTPSEEIIDQILKLEKPEEQMDWVTVQLRAALIRCYLCLRLVRTADLCAPINCRHGNNPIWLENWNEMLALLQDGQQLLMRAEDLEAVISALRMESATQEDYALGFFRSTIRQGEDMYRVFSGERWFLYQMVTDIYQTPAFQKLTPKEHNLFYLYLILHGKLRGQLIQSNDLIGFDNFQRIQNRKWDYLGDAASKRLITELAIREPLVTKPHLKELEVRLSPSMNAENNARNIQTLDRSVTSGERFGEPENLQELKDRYYYVYHFIKEPDSALQQTSRFDLSQEYLAPYILEYRHYRKRYDIWKQALEIIKFREWYPSSASRVRGIDACSQEIGCRPEVFAPVFRLLGCHSASEFKDGVEIPLPKLGKTYHVVEDFLDLVDGLRAIQEAIYFLNLDCGDRLGHAIALGIDVDNWYAGKQNRIALPVQDLLDNLAWFCHALQHYKVPDSDLLRRELNKEFEYWFRIVYLNYMQDEDMQVIMQSAEQEYQNDETKRNYHKHLCHFGIDTYYQAWTLRGDAPELYRKGYFSAPAAPLTDWDRCAESHIFPVRFETRYVPECSLLNYYYHYNPMVKLEGNRQVTTLISPAYIRGAKAVQHALRQEIAARGISIETNPSSNVLISNFRRYDKHPILSFYNRGLPVTQEEENACPQLSVSINTDDKGVFYTDLENEFALLARSLEECMDAHEQPRFRKNDIYAWLDNIRIMGLEQGFVSE